jgi:3-hydroxyisobutyrate dehydrogenase
MTTDSPTVAFIGLGAMGAPIAANLAAALPTRVYNRTTEVATTHAKEHGSVAVAELDDLVTDDVSIVFTCLPTDVEVARIAGDLGPRLAAGTVWVDHTSGAPEGSREVAELLAGHGVRYLDAPVSGGVDGARAGRMTTMVGGDEAALTEVRPVLEVTCARIVHVGPVGAGMAVKAVNNAMLAANLWAAAEGLAALTKAGVPASTALDVINASSGRSNATENLLPERAVTRDFPFTFALSLLAKDVDLAGAVLDETAVHGEVLEVVQRLTRAAADELGPEADHVELVRIVEGAAGVELR